MFHQDLVLTVDTKARPFTITTNDTEIKTHSIVVATGADSRWLGVEGEWAMRGGGVSSCATCDGYLFADQDVVVIGGGDTAMEDALVLARTSKSVTVIHRRDKFRASKVLAERVLAHDKIKVRWDTEVLAFEGKRQRVLSNGMAVEIDADGKVVEEDMSKMRVKEVQKRLDAAGVSYVGKLWARAVTCAVLRACRLVGARLTASCACWHQVSRTRSSWWRRTRRLWRKRSRRRPTMTSRAAQSPRSAPC